MQTATAQRSLVVNKRHAWRRHQPLNMMTNDGMRLRHAALVAGHGPGAMMGLARAQAFSKHVLPILAESAAAQLGVSPRVLVSILSPEVERSATVGLIRNGNTLKADVDYPPRAANAVWPKLADALGFSREVAQQVMVLNKRIAGYEQAEGKYSPAFESLSDDLKAITRKVTLSLLGERTGPLTEVEKAFKASLVLNNTKWHEINWQRGAEDSARLKPLDRDRNYVFNTYADNLAYAFTRGGLAAVLDMAISDAYNAGKVLNA